MKSEKKMSYPLNLSTHDLVWENSDLFWCQNCNHYTLASSSLCMYRTLLNVCRIWAMLICKLFTPQRLPVAFPPFTSRNIIYLCNSYICISLRSSISSMVSNVNLWSFGTIGVKFWFSCIIVSMLHTIFM